MVWDVRNVGWPVPYGDTWPISSRPPPSPLQESPSPTKHYIVVYGYSPFYSETNKGWLIDTWA